MTAYVKVKVDLKLAELFLDLYQGSGNDDVLLSISFSEFKEELDKERRKFLSALTKAQGEVLLRCPDGWFTPYGTDLSLIKNFRSYLDKLAEKGFLEVRVIGTPPDDLQREYKLTDKGQLRRLALET